MIRTCLIALLCGSALLGSVAVCSNASADWTNTAFPVKKHDFGTVAVGADTEYRFPIKNPFSSELHIQSIRTSCGCTTPTIELKTIPVGGEGAITARFNTPTFRGKKGATLTVIIDRPVFAEVRLRVDGYIRSDMVFHPGAVEFGSTDSGIESDRSAKIMYAGRSNWAIVDVQSHVPWLKPSVTELNRGGGKINYQLDVKLTADAPTGFFQNEIVVTTNDRAMPRVPLRVSGTVESPLVVSPRSIALGRLKPGESVKQRLVVRGAEAFTIDSITCEGWEIDFDRNAPASKVHVLTTRFTPIDASGPQKVDVVISTGAKMSQHARALVTADIRSQ